MKKIASLLILILFLFTSQVIASANTVRGHKQNFELGALRHGSTMMDFSQQEIQISSQSIINASVFGKVVKPEPLPDPLSYQLSSFMPNMIFLQCLDSSKDLIFNRGFSIKNKSAIWTKTQFAKLELSKNNDFTTNNTSVMVGYDAYKNDNLLLGLALQSKKYCANQNKSSGDLNKISAGLYTYFVKKNYDVKVSFLGSVDSYNLSRVNTLNETYNSAFQGLSGNIDVEAVYNINILERTNSNTSLKPYIGVSFLFACPDEFKEKGLYNALSIKATNLDRTILNFGLKLCGNRADNFRWNLQADAGNVVKGRDIGLECKRASTLEDITVYSINPGAFGINASLDTAFNILEEIELSLGTKISRFEYLTEISGNLGGKYKF